LPGINPLDTVVLADFNGDEELDAVQVGSYGFRVYLGLGTGSLAPGVLYSTTSSLNGATAGDFNGDGKPDLAIASFNSHGVWVFLNDGAGGFAPGSLNLVGSDPSYVAVGDFNEDGKADLAVTDLANGGMLSTLLGQGDGTFVAGTSSPAGPNPATLVVGDLDADGHLDVVVGAYTATPWHTVSVLRGLGNGGFAATAYYDVGGWDYPSFPALGDFNEDGKLDLAVGVGAGISTLLGDGLGGFGSPTVHGTDYPGWIAAADFDLDGHLDLAAASASGVLLLSGAGDGSFGSPQYHSGVTAGVLSVGDLNGDGRPDLAVVGSDGLSILRGDGAAGFDQPATLPAGIYPGPVAVADINLDGNQDFAVSDTISGVVDARLGDGLGGFGPANTIYSTAGAGPTDLLSADFNHDGAPDLAVGTTTGVAILLSVAGGGSVPLITNVGSGVGRLAAGDFDEDGNVDLFVTVGTGLAFLRGDGAGGFDSPLLLPYQLSAIVAGDFNGDTHLDLAGVGPNGSEGVVRVFRGDGSGALGPPTEYPYALFQTTSLAAGDIDGDGLVDLVVATLGNTQTSNPGSVWVLRGDAQATLDPPLAVGFGFTTDLALQDLDGDGRLDLVQKLWEGNVLMRRGTGATGFWDVAGSVFAAPTTTSVYRTSLAAGDFNRDGRPDLVLAGGYARVVTLLLNTTCAARRLGVRRQVSSCNTPEVAFPTQPEVGVYDDAGSLACAATTLTASLLAGAGTPEAVLRGPLTVTATAGIASYANLSVDLPGHGYRLGFQNPSAGATRSRTFSQGLSVAIVGQGSICVGGSASYDTGGGYDSYAWQLDGNPLSTAPTVSLIDPPAGSHLLEVAVGADGCAASAARPLTVGDLTSVVVSSGGSTNVCTQCTGGTVAVADSGGGVPAHQWGFRTVTGGPISSLGGETGDSYQIEGVDFPGSGSYLLVETTAPQCGPMTVSNELPLTVADLPYALSRNELVHGSREVRDLASAAGYRIGQAPRSSWELTADGVTGDAAPLLLDRMAPDGTTVLQSATTTGPGSTFSLSWENAGPGRNDEERIRVEGACTPACDGNDQFRIRARETTATVPRFNDSGSQVTVLLLQNTVEATVNGHVWFYDSAGTLQASRAFSIESRGSLALDTSAVVPGVGGTLTVSHDGGYGALRGKAVALEPVTGFTFDTEIQYRPR
jgi:hypothetical protein